MRAVVTMRLLQLLFYKSVARTRLVKIEETQCALATCKVWNSATAPQPHAVPSAVYK
jgi:hypothetical protein